MKGKIRKCDKTGDSVLAEFDTENAESVKVAEDALEAFLKECIKQYGKEPPVWAKRAGSKEFEMFSPHTERLTNVEEMICQYPLVGG